MRIGFGLPSMGAAAGPDALVAAAKRAEELEYDSLWVVERLLYPANPQTPYPATPDGSLPEAYKVVLDPVETLTFVAAHTKTIALGTSVLDMPYYNPVMLSRRLTTLDVLSGGRLRVGLGLGWSKDEYEATGASFARRGARADEFIQVLKAIWTTDPVEFHGEFFQVPQSTIQPKPVQKPHPPIYLGAFAPPAVKRAARLADGWNAVGMPPAQMEEVFNGMKQIAKAEGRDPEKLQLVVRANMELSEKPMGKDRWPFVGSLDQIKEDIQACRQVGADELFFDPIFSPDGESLEGFLKVMEKIRGLV